MRTKLSLVALTLLTLLLLNSFGSVLVSKLVVVNAKIDPIFSDGFESGTILTSDSPAGAWDGDAPVPASTIQVVSSPVHSGSHALFLGTDGSRSEDVKVWKNFTQLSTAYGRCYVRFGALNIANGYSLIVWFIGNQTYDLLTSQARVYNNGGTLIWQLFQEDDSANHYMINCSSGPVINQWYCLELERIQDASNGGAAMWVDGVKVANITGLNTALTGYTCQCACDGESNGYFVDSNYFDDVVIDSSYIGPLRTVALPLSGWQMDPQYTNASYVLTSTTSSLYLQLNATNTSSRVTIFNPNIPKLKLSSYTYVNATVAGTNNAKILLRFFMDDGTGFDVAYWQNPATLNATRFDLSPYAGRTLSQVYIALMSADGATANITVTQIVFSTQALPPLVPLSKWQVDPQYTNASYVLTSTTSSLYLQLNATNTSSRVTIFNPNIPKLKLSDYTYMNTTVSGTSNAKILLRFFLDDGSGFDVVYWQSPATLNAVKFDLSPYAGKTINEVYIALMSSNGTTANITITQIAFATHVLPPIIPLTEWQEDPQYTNATYFMNSNPSSLYLELDATNTSSRVTIFNPNIPKLKLSSYTYVNATVAGTNNAKILLRFFLDDGTGFDVVYWGSPTTLNTTKFDLSPYAGRTLSEVYVAIMSSDGTQAHITITQIAFVHV